MKYTYKQSATCSLKSNQANPFLQFLFVFSDQGWIPMLRGPRHMPGAGPLRLFANPFPLAFFPPSLFLTLTPISLSPFVRIFISSPLPIFHFLFFSFFFQYLNALPEGPAGPPEARGPRHVPFVPLWGSGTVFSGSLALLLFIGLDLHLGIRAAASIGDKVL